MTNPNQFPERRKFTRFKVKDRSFALNTKFGPIVDISMDGLTFLHMPTDRDSNETTADTGILFAGETPFCEPLPVKVITDQTAGDGSALLRRGGLQFGDLTQEQLSQLESFIVKGQRLDRKKTKPTSEELAARVRELERVVKNIKEKQVKDKKLKIGVPFKGREDERNLNSIMLICSYCKNIKDEQESWQDIEKHFGDQFDIKFSHGICPDCSKKYYPNLFDKEK